MKLAVMQPYFMPYLGYWQLLAAVDRFVVLDDVAFIQRGWVNRNRILVNGESHLFTLPLRSASQNRRINELELAVDASWLRRFRSTLRQSYQRAPYFEETSALLDPILNKCSDLLLPLLLDSIHAVAGHLEIGTSLALASALDPDRRNHGQERILDLCRRENATAYYNLPGGKALYDSEAFQRAGILLRFVEPEQARYPQSSGQWTPWLSIIDVMMHLGRAGTRRMLGCHRIAEIEHVCH